MKTTRTIIVGVGLFCTGLFIYTNSMMWFRTINKDQRAKPTADASVEHQHLDTSLLRGIEKEFRRKIDGLQSELSPEEEIRYRQCIQNGPKDRDENGSQFWQDRHVRHTHHTYLKENSVIIEVGGNRGSDTNKFVMLYNPRIITLEPVEEYANQFRKRFEENKKVTVLNIGLSDKTEVVYTQLDGVGTSKFKFLEPIDGGRLVLVNATEFFLKCGINRLNVDLLSINCEGCEFDVLEAILFSSLVSHFKHIQFATHTTLPGLNNPIARYCKIQELLYRTHTPTYQYRFIWEGWKRKDIV